MVILTNPQLVIHGVKYFGFIVKITMAIVSYQGTTVPDMGTNDESKSQF